MMQTILLKALGGAISFASGLIKQRILNKHTPKGVLMLLSGAYAFKYLDENQVNFIIQLMYTLNLSLSDLYFMILNILVVFFLAMGMWLIFAKVKQEVKKLC